MAQSHTSLNRLGEFVTSLPADAVTNKTTTGWEHAVEMIVTNPGRWYKLHRLYKNGFSSPANSARRMLEENHPAEVASRFEAASRLAQDNGDGKFYEVYIRIAPEPGDG